MAVCSVQISFYIHFFFFFTISDFPLATKATENDHTKNFWQNIAAKTEYIADRNVAFHYQSLCQAGFHRIQGRWRCCQGQKGMLMYVSCTTAKIFMKSKKMNH